MSAVREQQPQFALPQGKALRKLMQKVYESQFRKARMDLEIVEVREWIKVSHELEAYVTQQS